MHSGSEDVKGAPSRSVRAAVRDIPGPSSLCVLVAAAELLAVFWAGSSGADMLAPLRWVASGVGGLAAVVQGPSKLTSEDSMSQVARPVGDRSGQP